MKTFPTLLRREWMQHHRGWLILMLAPMLIALLVLALGEFGIAQFQIDGHETGEQPTVLMLALLAMVASLAGTLVIAGLNAGFQLPSLARRDQQDRSIEFWLSLPVGHAQSVAATLLMHAVLMPLLALAVGLVGGLLVSLLLVVRTFGIGDWFSLPWGAVLPGLLALTFRLALGTVLSALWLSPLYMLAMAASAWLKRWGVPVLVIGIALIGQLLDKLYANPVVWDTLEALGKEAGFALASGRGVKGGFAVRSGDDIPAALQALPGWAWHDAIAAIERLASPLFVASLLVAAAAFALLVWRRQRGS